MDCRYVVVEIRGGSIFRKDRGWDFWDFHSESSSNEIKGEKDDL